MTDFNRAPGVEIEVADGDFVKGWENVCSRLLISLGKSHSPVKILVVDTYIGVLDEEILPALLHGIRPTLVIDASDALKTENAIRELTQNDVTNDRIFGFMTRLVMADFFDLSVIGKQKKEIASLKEGIVLIYGIGASLIDNRPDVLVYVDMARWEIQQRMRKNEVNNLGINNASEEMELKYKRGFFVDWRVCDKHKKNIFRNWDFVLDTNTRTRPSMLTGDAFRQALDKTVHQPFSIVPYFDPGIWGGQWMKEVCGLDKSAENYAWCFNCVPEENSLLLKIGQDAFETPSINLVFYHPAKLLGEAVHGRFGDEFPIRFDFLDTMDGGNLSLQVHPLTEYIQEKFGMHYTQDESYYIMDAKPGAGVYLGIQGTADIKAFQDELIHSDKGKTEFHADKFIGKWPAKKHDHFLIPAGTIHCSGKDSMVLEISATPYIFTFKLWDWGRVGLDGKPRPINVNHGLNVIQWERNTSWVKANLINRIEKVAEGEGWLEERTGLHEREFIETRRHWFTNKVLHQTHGGVNVVCLVEGEEVLVESPAALFEPWVVRYAETFIVPAAVGEYTIEPYGRSAGKKCASVKAFVRTHA